MKTTMEKCAGFQSKPPAPDQSLDVYVSGEAYEAGSGWQPGIVYYAGVSGLLTATPPANGILKVVGVGVATDTVLINNSFEVLTS
jgi:hypothetical protein